jgi:hypothetical protein
VSLVDLVGNHSKAKWNQAVSRAMLPPTR